MSKRKLLMVEDDTDLVEIMKIHISDLGFELDVAYDGAKGLSMAQAGNYDLILLDCMLPEMDGFEVCRHIRETNEQVPIMMLTSRSDEVDKVVGLNSGADDYVTKPYKLAELIARINALLRRASTKTVADTSGENTVRTFGDLKIDTYRLKVYRGEKEIPLTAREYEIIELLSANPGRPFSKEQILELVWETDLQSYEHSVTLAVSRARKKLEDNPENPVFLLTVRGVGYCFVEPSALEQT